MPSHQGLDGLSPFVLTLEVILFTCKKLFTIQF